MSNLAELRANVYLRIAEVSGANFSDAEIDRMIQREYEDVIVELSMKNEEYLSKQVLTNTTGAESYALPTDLVKLLSIEYLPDGQDTWEPIPPIEAHRREQVQGSRYWLYSTSANRMYYTLIGNNYYIVPAPTASATDNLRLIYVYIPTALTEDADEPQFPSIYHEILEIGAANRLRVTLREAPIDAEQYIMKRQGLIDTVAPRVKANPKQVRMIPGGLY